MDLVISGRLILSKGSFRSIQNISTVPKYISGAK